jgi:hypothetical protein
LATPSARSFQLAGPDGTRVAVRVTSGGGRRPAVVLGHSLPGLGDRLARAGFATVVFDPETQPALAVAIAALEGGMLGVEADRWAVLEPRRDGSIAVARVAAGTRTRGEPAGDTETIVQWLVKHLA